MQYSIDVLRERIDALDQALLNILIQRFSIMGLVSSIKKEQNLSVFQPDREKKIFECLLQFANRHEMDEAFFIELFETIISQSKRIEHDLMEGGKPRSPFSGF
jgi:chorismate mutase